MSVFTVIVGKVEAVASDVLHFLAPVGKVIEKVEGLAPSVIAALATIAGGIEKIFQDATTQPFSAQEIADLKAVWSDVIAFLQAIGIKVS